MRLVQFTHTNAYDVKAFIGVNADMVVSIAPLMKQADKTVVALSNGHEVTVDGTLPQIAAKLGGVYDVPAGPRPSEAQSRQGSDDDANGSSSSSLPALEDKSGVPMQPPEEGEDYPF